MQTFLPYADYAKSAACLDRQRLGKQRVEALQILLTLLGERKGWGNHPAVRMWAGHEGALHAYACSMCEEWGRRGYKNVLVTARLKALKRGNTRTGRLLAETCGLPAWMGDERFHASHRSNLLRKDLEWYGEFGWVEGAEMEYVWPVG